MKFEDEVKFLRRLGLVAIMPDGKPHSISRGLRNPRGTVPVRVLKNGDLPKEVRESIRRTRAEYRKFRQSRNNV